MKRIFLILVSAIAILCGIRLLRIQSAESAAFAAREDFIAETNHCLETRQWKCAERNVRELLGKSPNDTNLRTHLAGILFEQERYAECRRYIAGLEFSSADLEYLDKKSAALLREMQELGIENSGHFRLEFEGNPVREDVMETLSVLEVAYDSLGSLFHFYPEDKIPIVLYRSEEFQGTGPRPAWAGAVFDGKLRIPAGLMKFREIYRPVLFHELTHAFVSAMTRGRIPTWLNEGIAQTIDGSNRGTARPGGDAPSLQVLSAPFVDEPNAKTAKTLYWYSEAMVERLLERKPESEAFSAFRDCIRDLRSLGTDKSLQKHFGITAEKLWEETK